MPRRLKHLPRFLIPCLGILVGCRSPETDGAKQQSSPFVTRTAEDTGLHFADVTDVAGIAFVHSIGDNDLSNLVESNGGGAAFLDYDQDGYLDLYAVSGTYLEGLSDGPPPKPRARATNRLYRNRGDGTFEDVTERARVTSTGYGMGVAVGDFDNDGYPDLYVSNHGPNILFRNNRDGTFSDVTPTAGVGGDRDGCSVGAAWFDYDNDGLLDLYVGNYIKFDPEYRRFYNPDGFPGPLAYAGQPDVLYRNRGDGTFEDVTAQAGVMLPDGRAMGIGAADYDSDGFVDVFVANDAMQNNLFHNLRGSKFKDVAIPAGVAFNHRGEAASSMTVSFADYDGDGLLDMFVPDMSYGALYRNEGAGVFSDATYESGIALTSGQYVGWAAAFIDYDNDGDEDLFQVNGDAHHLFGQQNLLFENQGDGTFKDVSTARGSYFRRKLVGRGAAFGDYDNDGDVDVFIVNLNDRAVLLRNEGGNRGSWLTIRLVGRRSNRDVVGARVTLVAGDRTQVAQRTSASSYLSQNDHRLHFGLGDRKAADRIEIVWPSGVKQTLRDVPARQIITIDEPER